MRRASKSEIVSILREVTDILTENDIPYWLDYGTLLGAVRRGGFISKDSDADISIYEDDAERTYALLESNLSDKRVLHHGFNGAGMQVFYNQYVQSHMDIFYWVKDDDFLRRVYYIPGVDDNKGKDFPSDWVSERTLMLFEGREYYVPKNPHQMCQFRYGDSYMTPLSNHEFNQHPNPNA